MIPGDQILVVMLGNKSIYPLSHLTLAHPTPFSSISTLTSSMVLSQNSSPASVCEMHK